MQRVAPFLRLDQDPYLAVSGGRLFWIQDAYAVYGEGKQLPADIPIPIDPNQTPQTRAVLKAAEEALRTGDWKGFGNAMRMLKDLLGEH